MKRGELGVVAILLCSWLITLASCRDHHGNHCPNNCSGKGTCDEGRCICQQGYGGEDCSYTDEPLHNGTFFRGSLHTRNWAFYHVNAKAGDSLRWIINSTEATSDCDVYINVNEFPTRGSYIVRDVSTQKNMEILQEDVKAGIWVAGIYAFSKCSYQITVQIFGSCPNACSGHGLCTLGQCACDPGYAAPDCRHPDATVLPGDGSVTKNKEIQSGDFQYYSTEVPDADTLLVYTMKVSSGDCDLYVDTSYPKVDTYLAMNQTLGDVSTIKLQAEQAGTYYAGVYGFWDCTYNISLTTVGKGQDCKTTTLCSKHGTCPNSIGGVCNCNTGYTGPNCERMTSPMKLGTAYTGYVSDDMWNYYTVSAETNDDLVIQLDQGNQGDDCDLYILGGADPTYTKFDFSSLTLRTSFNITIPNPLQTEWHIGVLGWSKCSYTLTAIVSKACPSGCQKHGTCTSTGQCVCNKGFAGLDCSIPATQLENGKPVEGQVSKNQWVYYVLNVKNAYSAEIRLIETTKHDSEPGQVWLYEAIQDFPTLRIYDEADTSSEQDGVHAISVELPQQMSTNIYVGVFGGPLSREGDPDTYKLVAWSAEFDKVAST